MRKTWGNESWCNMVRDRIQELNMTWEEADKALYKHFIASMKEAKHPFSYDAKDARQRLVRALQDWNQFREDSDCWQHKAFMSFIHCISDAISRYKKECEVQRRLKASGKDVLYAELTNVRAIIDRLLVDLHPIIDDEDYEEE